MKKWLLAGLALSFGIAAIAQDPDYGKILLTNHQITTTDASAELSYANEEVYQGRILRIVQSGDLKLHTDYPGLRTVEYLPKNAYLVEIAVEDLQAAKSFLQRKNARVLSFQSDWKLSKNLFYGDIPEWAWLNSQQIEMNLRHAPGITTSQVRQQLAADGHTVLATDADKRLITLAAKPGEAIALASYPFSIHLLEKEDPGQIENFKARTSHRLNYLQADFPGSVAYDGRGVTVGHGDDGALGDHIDFKGRLTQSASPSQGDHGDHVAGTIFGAGNLDPDGEGMAPGAEIYYQTYPSNLNSAESNFDQQGVRITSSSYSNGCNAGYTNFTAQMDQDAIDRPAMIHVFSAGNSGTSNCGYGAGSGWGNVTGGHKIAKNVIAVANMTGTDGLANSSSRGPASDGRIKPDVGAVGSNVYSTTDLPRPNMYDFKTGTSMSCPGVSGVLAVLYEAYRDTHNGNDPYHGGVLKSILMNTADDMGAAGPDFRYGYGRINARKALEAIQNDQFLVDSISSTSSSNTHTINVPSNVKEVRVMLYWPDAPASTVAARALVNDLDMDVNDGSNNFQPWVLDPRPNITTLGSPAVRARDSLNNVEQVTITDPGSSSLSVNVSAMSLPTGSQDYILSYEFIKDEIVITHPAGGEGFVSGSDEIIRWDAPEANTGSFTLEYSLDNGSSWNSLTNVSGGDRYYQWNLPNASSDEALVRVSRGSNSAQSPANFTILGTPQNIRFPQSCPDSAVIAWDSVPNATGYIVYQLGAEYMDSIGYTSKTNYKFAQQNVTQSDWLSVAAVLNDGVGKRAVAVDKPKGIYGCTLQNDVGLEAITSPSAGAGSGCYPTTNIPLTVQVQNTGLDSIGKFEISYILNNGGVITDSVKSGLSSGAVLSYTFSQNISLNSGINNLRVWIEDTIDDNFYNDTLEQVINVGAGTTQSIPYFENFQSFSTCSNATNCGATKCNLSNGWDNPANAIIDDIDWRTNLGATPSSQTGPNTDNSGQASGKYLYLEASGGCDSAEAYLISPCFYIDTSFSKNLFAEYYYHMLGQDMGTFSVDIVTEDSVILNAVPKVVRGNDPNWQMQRIDLAPYAGMTISFRFRGKTGVGYRSDIAFDDFKIYDPSITAPTAGFTISTTEACVGDTLVFTDSSSANINTYEWDFGTDAQPASATGPGPHKVVYISDGRKNVSLRVKNGGGVDSQTSRPEILGTPNAVFVYSISGPRVNFTDLSSNSPYEWYWDFGDGDTSTAKSPSHSYQQAGTYYVQLTASNDCGSFTNGDSVTVSSGFSLEEGVLTSAKLYPNPNNGQFQVSLAPEAGRVTLEISDLGGKVIERRELDAQQAVLKLNYSTLKSGTYLLQLKNDEGAGKNFRMVVY